MIITAGYNAYPAEIERVRIEADHHVLRWYRNTVGLSFPMNGLYRYLDLPDLAALIAPRAVLVINGSQDRVFALDGV